MRPASVALTLLLLAQPAWAKQIWALWELDLAGHAPPTQFVLTVSSPSGSAVPPAMMVPWASCPTPLAGATAMSHCAPIGCPPTGTYEFWVQAQYGEGLSDKSNIARCTIPTNSAVCDCTVGAVAPPPPPPPAPAPSPPLPPPPITLITTPPPLPQQTAAGLNLLPVGDLPPIPTAPAIPPSGST